MGQTSVLLIGPYDPNCGEYTFLSPPLGVWRLAGVLTAAGFHAEVFDPNCCAESPRHALERELLRRPWDLIGVSTTGMTLRFDLELAHLARRLAPRALLVAGGMEATFRPELMFELAPFDRIVLGEGEHPLLEIAQRLRVGASLSDIPGTAERSGDGSVHRRHQRALSQIELREAIFSTPYEKMPFHSYWSRLERVYGTAALPSKAAREACLAEIRSVRLITLNYCPMACSFCSATNFLREAQGSVVPIARLNAEDCLRMIRRIVAAQPQVRTIIFQDDIFVFTKDQRVLPLCEAIIAAKRAGDLPSGLQFISTNRIDAMNAERLRAMRAAGFRVLGFGIENFSQQVLREFNKAQIYNHIDPTLQCALDSGITPFLDLILTSPRSSVQDLGETLRQAHRWLSVGCEIGIYPYVVPFSGAALARDESLAPHTTKTRQRVVGTNICWDQASKILPIDAEAREVILRIERNFESAMRRLQSRSAHLPSRVRSLVWLIAALEPMAALGHRIADADKLDAQLESWLPCTQITKPIAAPLTA